MLVLRRQFGQRIILQGSLAPGEAVVIEITNLNVHGVGVAIEAPDAVLVCREELAARMQADEPLRNPAMRRAAAAAVPSSVPPAAKRAKEAAAGGCALCGDFPALLSARCHPSAPLRAEMVGDHTLVLRCYLPTCFREVARLPLAAPVRGQDPRPAA